MISKNIDLSQWKSFKLSELFEIGGSKTTPKNKLEQFGNGIYPYVTTQATTNGIAGYYDLKTENGNCLTIDSAVLGVCFYQEKDFSASDHVEILRPKFEMNREIALFFTILINKIGKFLSYGYDKKRSQTALKQESILLPVNKNDEPDWEFMQDYIKQNQNELLNLIKLYENLLNNTGGGDLSPILLFIVLKTIQLKILKSLKISFARLLCK